MQINMTAVLTADDIAQAVAAFVATQTGNDASTINVTVPAEYTVTAVMGTSDTGWVAPKTEKETTKRTTRKAAPKKEPEPEPEIEKEPEPEVTEDNIPETSPESDTPDEEEKKENPIKRAASTSPKAGSIFAFQKGK